MWLGENGHYGDVRKRSLAQVLRVEGDSQGHFLSLDLKDIGEDWGRVEGFQAEEGAYQWW